MFKTDNAVQDINTASASFVSILVNNSNLAIIHKPKKIEESIDEDIIPSWLNTN